jgi:hypothetical protein
MAIGQKQVWAKVLDFTIQDYATKAVIAQVKYATDASISENYEKLEIKGGSENQIQYTNFHSPTAKFTANLPLIDDNIVAIKTGATNTTGSQRNAFESTFTVDATAGTITLPVTGIVSGSMKVYNVDVDDNLGTEVAVVASAPTLEQYSITGSVLTFATGKKGARMLVVCDYTTGATATGVKIVSGKLPKLVRITAKTKVEDKAGNVAIKTIIVEKAKPDPNFEFATSTSPASLPFECEVFGWTNEIGESQFFNLVTDPTLAV